MFSLIKVKGKTDSEKIRYILRNIGYTDKTGFFDESFPHVYIYHGQKAFAGFAKNIEEYIKLKANKTVIVFENWKEFINSNRCPDDLRT